MDIRTTLGNKSSQINADDLVGGPITVTIESVTPGDADQPVNINLVGFKGKPFKPNATMRKLLNAGWGWDTDTYTGKSLTLFRNPDVTFGKEKVGGVQISHMSHIAGPLVTSLLVKRGKREPFTVQPLETVDARTDLDDLIADAATVEELRALWPDATENQRNVIQARVNQLQAENAGDQA